MLYTYDFGDNWEYRIVVEEVGPLDAHTTYATCIGGRRAAPPDDIGGIWTFNDVVGGGPIDPELADWLPIGFDPVEFTVDDTARLLDVSGAKRSNARAPPSGRSGRSRSRCTARAGLGPLPTHT